MREKQSHPVAVCTKCGKYSVNISNFNERCGNRYGNKRCEGTWRSAISEGDWEECQTCQATGHFGDEPYCPCKHCRGSGWRYARKGF